jgi:ABC-type xylose transport system permease subunit
MTTRYETDATISSSRATGWVGWLLFSGVMLAMLGTFQGIMGFVALFDDGFFVRQRNGQLIAIDYSTWGWIHLGLAVLAIGTGIGLMLGSMIARVIAVILCVLNVVVSFAFLSASPWWAGMLIAFSVITAYAVIVHGGEVEEAYEEAYRG